MQEGHNLLAILGSTNTGKTYLAFDRLLSFQSGIFGFPLRLLARENYDKAKEKLGSEKVALITGEEKYLSKDAKYYFCTVESMPLNIDVECIAIDEVQLAADYERGHIFTDRILNLRGIYETIFLGSITMEKLLIRLFPKIKIQKRNRFSKLSFYPSKSLSKLNPRTAIVAFNLNSVYEIAESVRMHKGGAAVVLGSLSPRTRNAQVQIYEDKKVDYLVATDAIGMGLNLNINHVAFSSIHKFDGRYNRDLSKTELGQIAGRAGRYKNDGTFGYLKSVSYFDELTIKSIENHNFESIEKIYWRNSNIDFTSISSVFNSFNKFPIKDFFIHKKNAEDENNFRRLVDDQEIKKYLNDSKTISLLWDVCRIPDFQKIFNDTYIEMLKKIFLILIKNDGILNEKWLQDKILRLENYDGGIEELSIKIANIRTWTFIANQSSWINDYSYWQKKTYEIENLLSDQLHISLTNRFIDFSASYFIDTKKRGEKTIIEIDEQKSIKLNEQNYGYINGFDLKLKLQKFESLFSLIHVKKSIRSMIEDKVKNFLKAPLDSLNFGEISKLKINDEVKIYWGDEPIGKLKKGVDIFSPQAECLNSEFLESDKKLLISQKLQHWLQDEIAILLKPIKDPIDNTISSDVRFILFNVFNSLGTMLINNYSNTLKKLNESEKSEISKSGVRIGAKFFFIPNFLKKKPMEFNALLWRVFNESQNSNYYPLPLDGRVSFNTKVEMPESYWLAIGYKCLNGFALRIDVFERVFFLARQKLKYGPFLESADMMNPIGCNSDQLVVILDFCGFYSQKLDNNKKLFFQNQKKQPITNKISIKRKINIKKNNSKKIKIKVGKSISSSVKKENQPDPDSPFAVLEKLL